MPERLIDTEENIRQYNSGIDDCIDVMNHRIEYEINIDTCNVYLRIIKDFEKLKIRITK